MIFLEAKNIIKQYDKHRALNDVSIQVTKGNIYGLLGPNGAGKTTLIRIINRITAPDSGEVFFEGRPYTAKDIYNIGYLPEERGLYKKMKVWDHAIFLARLKGLSLKDSVTEINKWFEKFDIVSWKEKKIEELSKGMQQKVQFITTVVHKPDLLILDEPFSGLDPVNAEILKNAILELRDEGKTIILSTHNMASVEELCNEISLINRSQVVLQGNVSKIREDFRKGIFQFTLEGTEFNLVSDKFDIISTDTQKNKTIVKLEKHGEIKNSQIISEIANNYEIISFVEELPSMNDIFIQTTTKK